MKKYKVLIVDDDRQLADLAKMNFPPDKFSAKVCYSGSDALKEMENEKPDLLILDVVMPKMDGWDVLRELKKNSATSSIPVIMCTAKDNVGDVERSFHYGAQSYVIKPIDFKKLLNKAAAILDVEELLND